MISEERFIKLCESDTKLKEIMSSHGIVKLTFDELDSLLYVLDPDECRYVSTANDIRRAIDKFHHAKAGMSR